MTSSGSIRVPKAAAKAKSLHPPASRSGAVQFGANIATLKPTGSGKARPAKASVDAATSAPQKKKRMTKFNMHSAEDVGDALLKAAEGSSSNRKDRFLRSVFRRAVELEYDQAIAHSRVAAALGGRYTFIDTATTLLGEPTCMIVAFAKGMGSRLMLEDRVDFLSLDKLRAVVVFVLNGVRSVQQPLDDTSSIDVDGPITEMDFETKSYNRSMLKPDSMAGCSPRVFWSLVRHFGGDIINCLSQLIPGENWSWLAERPRKLSVKAAANADMQAYEEKERNRKKRKVSGNDEVILITDDSAIAGFPNTTTADASSDTACLNQWASQFIQKLNYKDAMLPLLYRIFQSNSICLDCIHTNVIKNEFTEADTECYRNLILKIFPDEFSKLFECTSLVDWSNLNHPADAHLTWSSFHRLRSRHVISTAQSTEFLTPNPNLMWMALTVWDFFDIVYMARTSVMQQLWRSFCTDVFSRDVAVERPEIQMLFTMVTYLALTTNPDATAEQLIGTKKIIRPRDISLWRLSSDNFHKRLCHFLRLCLNLAQFSCFSDVNISESDKVKLATDKIQIVKEVHCSWIDRENWCFFQGSVAEGSPISVVDNSVQLSLQKDEIITFFVSNLLFAPADLSDCSYNRMLEDLNQLRADAWLISCPKSRSTKDALLSRVLKLPFSATAVIEQNGSCLIGDLLMRTFSDGEESTKEYGIIIAFAEPSDQVDDDEDVSLWKVQYSCGEREDLEEFEVLRALSDMPTYSGVAIVP